MKYTYKDPLKPILTARETKGYLFELKVKESLRKNKIKFYGTPDDPCEWKKFIGYKSDIKIPLLGIEIECKNWRYIFPYNIKKDILARFSRELSTRS